MKNIVSMLVVALLFSPCINATQLKNLNNSSVTIKSCKYIKTDRGLDLALINKGYFVLKRGKSDRLYYTRLGDLRLLEDGDFITSTDAYVQGINPNNPFDTLKNIRLPSKGIGSLPTDKIELKLNLNALSTESGNNRVDVTLWDLLGAQHGLTLYLTKSALYNTWKTSIEIDGEAITTGQLVFNGAGELASQSGMDAIYWESTQGSQKTTLDFKDSTQYAAPFRVFSQKSNGHPSGRLASFSITPDGEFNLFYTNGVVKPLGLNLAIAFFDNPIKLKKITDNLYVATTASGTGEIQPSNGNGAILSGYLEKKRCFPTA